MNYQKKVYDTVKSYIESLSALDEKEREINKQVQMETLARVTAEQQREELKAQRSAAYTEAIQEIEHIRRSHSEAVDKWNELDGSKLSDDAKLLEMDIPMNQVQFQQLCTKHKDNSLMLSLLCQYADRHKDSDLYADRPADAATRKAEFDDYAARATNVCREPQSIRAGLFLENNGVAESVSYEY